MQCYQKAAYSFYCFSHFVLLDQNTGQIWLEMLLNAVQYYTYFAQNASFSVNRMAKGSWKESKFLKKLTPA